MYAAVSKEVQAADANIVEQRQLLIARMKGG